MNRYPVWKYVLIAIALLVGIIYTLPNFFPEAPAVQVSSSKATVKIDNALMASVETALHREAQRAVRCHRDRAQCRGERPARRHLAAPAQGHDQIALSTTPASRDACVRRGRLRPARPPENHVHSRP